MRQPTPHPQAFDIYWRFTAERQRIFLARSRGEQGPWTEDPILSKFKFCNAYRAADRVSQFLIRDVCYPVKEVADDDLAFQIVAFRTFSNIGTWRKLQDDLGRTPTLEDLANGDFERSLTAMRTRGERLYTGAFILCATDAYGRRIKHMNHIELFKDMFLGQKLASTITRAPSLRAVYDALHRFPLMGDFMSYQVAIDLNYSRLTDFSENDFTQPGPGALRGIKKVFTDIGSLSPSDIIQWMVERQDDEFARLGVDFPGLFGRPLQAIDAQNLFCETDKYCREALPSLVSARSRIKARFTQTGAPLPLFFPPKWGINDLVPESGKTLQPA